MKWAARFAALILSSTCVAAFGANDADFQPHPSHMPPPPPDGPPPAPAPLAYPLPQRLSGDAPEYPLKALRFNVQGTVIVKIMVNAKGKVEGSEIVAGVPMFGESVRQAVKNWRFEKRPGPSTVKFAIPFKMTGGPETSGIALREMTFAPTDPQQVPGKLTIGFSYIRLLIDATGNVINQLPLHYSEPAFEATTAAIVRTLKFAPAAPETAAGDMTVVNEFLIDYAEDGKIRVKQRSGL